MRQTIDAGTNRPIKQVSVAISEFGQLVFVVCVDGTAWSLEKNVWTQLPAIPGEKGSVS